MNHMLVVTSHGKGLGLAIGALLQRTFPRAEVVSALWDWTRAARPDSHFVRWSRARGLDIEHIRSRPLSQELVNNADVVIVLNAWQQCMVDETFPSARIKTVRLFGAWDVSEHTFDHRTAEHTAGRFQLRALGITNHRSRSGVDISEVDLERIEAGVVRYTRHLIEMQSTIAPEICPMEDEVSKPDIVTTASMSGLISPVSKQNSPPCANGDQPAS